MKLNIKYVAIAVFGIAFSSNSFAQQTQNIEQSAPLNNTLASVTRMEPISYEYNKSEAKKLKLSEGTNYGFNADDLEAIFPGAVKTRYKMVPAGKNNFKTVATKEVDMESLIPLLVGSIKEQQAEIEQLKAEVEALKKR